ncbi:hypothetical protein [Nesterenkonia suensis]
MARFWAYKLPGWTLLDGDLPLNNVTITRALSTPKSLDADLDRRYAHLLDDEGDPLVREWGTAIVSEVAGRVDVFIVDGTVTEGEQETLGISAGGVCAFAKDQPWLPANAAVRSALADLHAASVPRPKSLESGGESGGIGWVSRTGSISAVEVDPLNMVRAIWTMLLAAPRSDLRLTIDSTRSPVRIGEEERDVEFTTGAGEGVEFTAGPYKLSWHSSHDMGGEIDSLAQETPFEWAEESRWDGEQPSTRMRLWYPSKPTTRKTSLFFEVGANVVGISTVEFQKHASVVLVAGQGEGSDRVRAHVSEVTNRLRRVHVEADRGIRSKTRAIELGRELLEHYTSAPLISEITVTDHPAARFGTFDLGDVITVRGDVGWVRLDEDYRIVSISHDLTAETQTLALEVSP